MVGLPRCGKTGQNVAGMTETTIRTARLDDAAPVARLDVETWQATYAGILGTPYLAGLSAARREAGWSNLIRRSPLDVKVATNSAGDVVGFGSCGTARGEPDYTGEVFTLYVAPDWQNLGIGRRLLLAIFDRLVSHGHSSVVIWVLRENPARFFYQRLGGKEARRKLIAFNGIEIPALGYGWRDLPGYLSTVARTGKESET
jgi:ribosomal protein S18 acetylase RimI-like enzyme